MTELRAARSEKADQLPSVLLLFPDQFEQRYLEQVPGETMVQI